jgi:signal transduction histidine kinase/CheY-like chemotaxis protein
MAASLVVAAAIALGVLSGWRSRTSLTLETDRRVSQIRSDLTKRGTGVAATVALASERALVGLDYLFLTEIVSSTVKNDKEFVFGEMINKDGVVVVHSSPALAGKQAQPDVVRVAMAQKESTPTTRELEHEGQQVLEVIAPLNVGSERWGVVRFVLSLSAINAEIERAREEGKRQLSAAVTQSIAVSAAMIALGFILAGLAAGRITAPLKALLEGVERVKRGLLTERVAVSGASELVDLAENFNAMSIEIQNRDVAIQQTMRELRSALERAEEANRLKSEFLANISHELRTPLNAIVNIPVSLAADMIDSVAYRCPTCQSLYQLDPAVDPLVCPECQVKLSSEEVPMFVGDVKTHRHFLGRLRQSSQHLLSVVNDLLDFSKLEAGRMNLSREDVDVAAIVGETLVTVSGLAAEKGLQLSHDTLQPDMRVSADPVKLSQILINLIGNAIKFTERGGSVRVSVKAVEQQGFPYLRFRVADTGMGIPADKLEIVFESFRQVDGSHTRQHGGTGLGLSITKQLVELHGGAIWVESELGKGSTFTFVIPQKEDSPSFLPDTPSGPQSRGTVLVVDDSRAQLELVQLVLKQEGFQTVLVAASNQTIDRIRAAKPTMVILDIMMPEPSGLQVLETIRNDPDLAVMPVVVSTAFYSHESEAKRLGALWLPKPWDRLALIRLVREVSAKRANAESRGIEGKKA